MSEQAAAKVTITNKRGLHARASAKFCAVAGAFDADVTVSHAGLQVGGLSIMGLMMLGAGQGSEIEIMAKGPQGKEALVTLVQLVEELFGEEE
ncbi:MAG: HPr family phosphocarrier protein [bacterium]